jgi:DNA-binding phage protein
MTEKSQIATEKIADYLRLIMQDKGITAYQLEKKGIHKNAVYSVLRMGNNKSNYTIQSFIEVLGAIGVHMELHNLGEKSNLDLDKTGQN